MFLIYGAWLYGAAALAIRSIRKKIRNARLTQDQRAVLNIPPK
jgi:hypothetical protein